MKKPRWPHDPQRKFKWASPQERAEWKADKFNRQTVRWKLAKLRAGWVIQDFVGPNWKGVIVRAPKSPHHYFVITKSARGDAPADKPLQVTTFLVEDDTPIGHFYAKDLMEAGREIARDWGGLGPIEPVTWANPMIASMEEARTCAEPGCDRLAKVSRRRGQLYQARLCAMHEQRKRRYGSTAARKCVACGLQDTSRDAQEWIGRGAYLCRGCLTTQDARRKKRRWEWSQTPEARAADKRRRDTATPEQRAARLAYMAKWREARRAERRYMNPVDLTNPDVTPGRHDMDSAMERAVAAGAIPPLTYRGTGMTAHVFTDTTGRAFKVGRIALGETAPSPTVRRLLTDEAAWLKTANRGRVTREWVPRFYGFDPVNLVIVRDFVSGLSYGRHPKTGDYLDTQSNKRHEQLEAEMLKRGWTAPEAKPESWAWDEEDPSRGRIFDAGFVSKTGKRLVAAALQALKTGASREELNDLMRSVRNEATHWKSPTIPMRTARALLNKLAAAGGDPSLARDMGGERAANPPLVKLPTRGEGATPEIAFASLCKAIGAEKRRLLNFLKHAYGVKRVMAAGTGAIVFTARPGRIVKITTDRDDAAVASRIMQAGTTYLDILARVYSVHEIAPEPDDIPANFLAPLYVIEVERLHPLPPGQFSQDVQDYYESLLFLEPLERTIPGVIMKKFRRLVEVSGQLGAKLLQDAHEGNWGLRVEGDPSSMVLLDFGYSYVNEEERPMDAPRIYYNP